VRPRRSALIAFALGLALEVPIAHAQQSKDGSIRVDTPWARATVSGQRAGGGFLVIENKGRADRLVGATADVSRTVELHTMSTENDVMRMRQVDAIDVPARGKVELRPGGLHVMFIDLKAGLKPGDTFPVKLRFEKAGEVEVRMKVEPLGYRPPGMEKPKP
jgi:copper(I)-binding protein